MRSQIAWALVLLFAVTAISGRAADVSAKAADSKKPAASTATAVTKSASPAKEDAKADAKSQAKAPERPAGGPEIQAEAKPAAEAAAPKAVQADAKEKAAAKANFEKVFGEWKALIGELVALQVKYRSANEDKRLEIRQQWSELIAKGEKMENNLIDAAQKAYAAAPNEDKSLANFLFGIMAKKLERDDYESAAKIGKLLMEHQCTEKELPALAGIAACVVGDYDAAERYLTDAVKKKCSLAIDNDHDYVEQLVKAFLANPEGFKNAWAKEQKIRENEANADNLPRVLLKTTKGDIELELFENEAPLTVANFIYLVDKKFYNGLTFHRVLPGFMLQGGDPNGDGTGGPGYAIPCECYKPNARLHFRGSLSMAKSGSGGSDGMGRDTGGSQFFITFVPTATLNGRHTVFGRVIKGMDVLAKIQRRNPDDQEAPQPDKIIEAKVIRKRAHPYVPKKVE